MSIALQALFWGLLSGFALVIGALAGYFVNLPQRVVAAVMAFGSGILISALSLDLMEEAYRHGGFASTALGFIGGSAVYTLANVVLARYGAKHRKRSDRQQKSESGQSGSGLAIAIGSLLDGIPESIAIGVSMIAGGAVSTVTVVAVFLSNVPEGLSSSAGMRKARRSKIYVFGIWTAIAVLSGIASWAGYAIFSHLSSGVVAATDAAAAGAILTMLSDTMIPEAFASTHDMSGMITVLGFLAAFVLSKMQ